MERNPELKVRIYIEIMRCYNAILCKLRQLDCATVERSVHGSQLQ